MAVLDLKSAFEADEMGIRLEMTAGIGTWETFPAKRHISTTKRIEKSIRPSPETGDACGCWSYQDLYIRFADGSLKRPDISIFCHEPEEEDEAVTMVPGAVVEVISRGFERKDLEVNPPFYLSQRVKDVVIVDPYEMKTYHHTAERVEVYSSPKLIRLTMGCEITA